MGAIGGIPFQRFVAFIRGHNLQFIAIGSYPVGNLNRVQFYQSMFASYRYCVWERVVWLRRIFKNDNTNNNKVIILLPENSSGLRSRRLLAGSSETSRNELTKNLIPTISMLCWKNCCIWNYQQTQETVLVTLLSTFLSTNNGCNEK